MNNAFVEWLQTVCGRIADVETRGRACVERGDAEGYRALMREKAEFLAGLGEEGRAHLAALPSPLRERASARLRNFSASAQSALSLDSVFYMSALLYPDEHEPGEPNNLELFRDEVKAAL
ncbi:MAG: hypothetical protein J1E80_03435 [Desulfovibrionaceae bacterium]|nr:hypothetical protein [Desulfovibrionaceae bacterium]